MADEATGATEEFVEILIIPKCGSSLGNDKPKAGPEENDGEIMDALGKEQGD